MVADDGERSTVLNMVVCNENYTIKRRDYY